MRSAALGLALFWLATGCSEPRCGIGEFRVGAVCKRIRILDSDASSAESPAHADGGHSTSNVVDDGLDAASEPEPDDQDLEEHAPNSPDATATTQDATAATLPDAAPPQCIRCGPHARCVLATTTCECEPGYAKNRFGDCDDVDECVDPSFCAAGKQCMNEPGSAECTCPAPGLGPNLLTDSGFESQGSTVGAPWVSSTNAPGTQAHTIVAGHSGSKAARIAQSTGWADIFQQAIIETNTPYRVTFWMRTSANTRSGHAGIRGGSLEVNLDSTGEIHSEPWVQKSFDFNSTSVTTERALAQFYIGLWAAGESWLEVDDVTFQEIKAAPCK